MTRLYFIRHGESVSNLITQFAGSLDMPLTERGRAQADATAKFLKDVPFSCVYASDLCRAYDTGADVANSHGISIHPMPQLREIFAGEWEGQKFEVLEKKYPESYHIWCHDTARSHPDGGEKVTDLAARFDAAVRAIAEENEGKTVLIVAHATPIRIMACLWSGKGLDHLEETPWPANVSVTCGEYENGKFSLLSYGVHDFLSPADTTRQEDEA